VTKKGWHGREKRRSAKQTEHRKQKRLDARGRQEHERRQEMDRRGYRR